MANIMVVDDDVLVRSVLREVLVLNKHTVMEAADGEDALELINPNALPDLIFMDYQMPKRTGMDAARQLKSLYPLLRIVLISGSFGNQDDACLAANKYLFTGIILKPFQIKDIVRIVECALGDRKELAGSRTCLGQLTEELSGV